MKKALQFKVVNRRFSLLGLLMLMAGAAWSQTTYNYTGSLQTYTVPAGVTEIQIEAWGAQGGGGLSNVTGGLGAYISGNFTVTGGQVITILVGGEGAAGTDDTEQAGGTGGGGSFVVDDVNNPLVVAGGGGGAMGRYNLLANGGDGQITENGQDGALNGGAGGTMGNGGYTWPWTGWHSGTGGGGFYTDGSAPSNGSGSYGTENGPGIAFVNGGAGGYAGSLGRAGGYGGGGAAGFTGGGGGGYSGGGSGTHDSPQTYNGGGGGSYNGGTNPVVQSGVRSGDGMVVISEVCTPATMTPDVATLSDLNGICSVDTTAAPTATNDCGNTVSGTPDVSFPITTYGSHTVTWTYTDGLNTITQTQNVIVNGPNVGVNQTGTTLNADAIGAQYQWMVCDTLGNYPVIMGETNQSYQPTVTGYYAVEVTEAGCTDTSSCILVDFTGLSELENEKITVYPNPSEGGILTVLFDGEIIDLKVKDMLGREVTVNTDAVSGTIDAEPLAPGNYMVIIQTNTGVITKEVVILE